MGSDVLTRVSPVMVGDRRVGLVQLVGNDSEVFDWLAIQGVVTLGALGVGTLIAFGLTRRMRLRITRPVMDLAAAAQQVTATGDYTVRAKKSTDDEVGALADAFNRMLDQIQQRPPAEGRISRGPVT